MQYTVAGHNSGREAAGIRRPNFARLIDSGLANLYTETQHF